jgi:hypothetical protein
MLQPTPITLTVEVHSDDADQYAAYGTDGDAVISYIPEELVDLIPYMCARRLLAKGFDVERMLVVNMLGSDRVMLRRPLGVAAATPLPNDAAPVSEPARRIYQRKPHRHG